MKRLLVVLLVFVSCGCFSQVKDKETLKQIQEMKIDKKQLSSLVEMMKQGGHISGEQAEKAQKKLQKMTDKDVDNLKSKAIGVLKEK